MPEATLPSIVDAVSTPVTARSQPTPDLAPTAATPPESRAAAELRVLSAPAVVEKAKRKEKPKTAKEALRARAEQRSGRGPVKRATKPEREKRVAKEPEEREPERADEEAPSSERSEPPSSFWGRIKRIFSGS